MINVPIPVQQRQSSYSIRKLIYTSNHIYNPYLIQQTKIINHHNHYKIYLHKRETNLINLQLSFNEIYKLIKIQNMIKSSINCFRGLLSRFKYNASFYKTVQFFTNLQQISGSIEKQKTITSFRQSLPQNDLKQFDELMNHINKKIKIGITTKVVYNYYLKKFVNESQKPTVLTQLTQGGLPNRVCIKDAQSQMTLYDINTFLKYIREVKGTGSQTEKAQKIIDVVENVSKLQGTYFLRLIDHKLTIGAQAKTFKNAKISEAKSETKI